MFKTHPSFYCPEMISKVSRTQWVFPSLEGYLSPLNLRLEGGREKSHDAVIKNEPLHLITAPLSNWRSAVNILSNQCHPSPTPQAAAINPSCSGMPGLTKMVALLQTSFYNGCVEIPPSHVSTFKWESVFLLFVRCGWRDMQRMSTCCRRRTVDWQ